MAYDLTELNYKTVSDPKGLVEEGDAAYYSRVSEAAERILAHHMESPIVLLSGPSGSGKTTTARKISEELERRGLGTHYVSMDDYFLTPDPLTFPRTAEGDYDLESPLCMDMELLNTHFSALSRGEAIDVPRFDFPTQMRLAEPSKRIALKSDEVVVFEGIHALNPLITTVHPEAFKLYISAHSDVTFQGQVVFYRTWFRLVRRAVRDYNFRATPAALTMQRWANVCRGEELYISPYRANADLRFDSSLCYELPAFNSIATQLFSEVPQGIARFDELRQVLPALQLFGHIDHDLIPKDSLIREFLGGGIYD